MMQGRDIMSYRICYEKEPAKLWRWGMWAVFFGVMVWCAFAMGPVWQTGEGLYETLARYVGGMILGSS